MASANNLPVQMAIKLRDLEPEQLTSSRDDDVTTQLAQALHASG
jgi:hypothetical protein